PNAVCRTHGLKRVVAPIFRIRWSRHWRRRYRGQPGDLRRLALDGSGDTPELGRGVAHQWRMEGVGDSQQSASDAETFKMRNESRNRLPRARDNRVFRRIQRGDSDALAVKLLHRRCDGFFIRENGGHGAITWQTLHKARTLHEEVQDLLQRVDARAVGSRKLADAVSQNHIWNDSPGPPQRNEAGLDREQRRLRIGGVVDQ